MKGDLSRNNVLRFLARGFQIIVGIVLLVAATLKGFDPGAFADEIMSYGITPESWSMFLAWGLVIGEWILGIALVVNLWPRVTILSGIVLMLLFIAVTAYAWMQGSASACGCFGNLVNRSHEEVLVEDAFFLVMLLFALPVLWQTRQEAPVWKLATTVSGGVLAALLLVFHMALPVDNIATNLKPGAVFNSWPVEGLHVNMNDGKYIIVLFSLETGTDSNVIEHINALTEGGGLPTVIALTIDGPETLGSLSFSSGLAAQPGAIEPRFARSLYRELPRTFLLDNGEVKYVWNGIPPVAEVKSIL
ncbi:MAG: hypothetical protein GXO82_00590 [Chlorobi bacterium]|nr:hypothetical protein [Chlorobiota bacterium]